MYGTDGARQLAFSDVFWHLLSLSLDEFLQCFWANAHRTADANYSQLLIGDQASHRPDADFQGMRGVIHGQERAEGSVGAAVRHNITSRAEGMTQAAVASRAA
jgi:hypothetical protein